LLKILLTASLAIPVILFGVVSWVSYKTALLDAERDLLRTSEVAREHAAKMFDGQSQVADRVNDLLTGLDAAAIRQSERSLHNAFASIVGRLPQVLSVLLVGLDGHPLVSAGIYPVPATADVSERDYFQAIAGGYLGTFVSSLQVGEVNRQLFFGLGRPWTGADGHLRGVIDVAVAPSIFSDFYRVLVGEGRDGAEGKVVSLIRDDGQILVRFPPFEGMPPRAPPDGPLFSAIRTQPDRGVYIGRSIIDSDAPERLFAYRKVQGYPVYVVAGRSRDRVIAGWRKAMQGHLAFGLPATLALFAITWTALVRTRREGEALAQAQREAQLREAAEAALLRAQRLEAVGQMTGGVAHDFNNLLTIMLGGSDMLRRRANDPDRVRLIADQIGLAARRGGEITQQLLAFSRRQTVKAEVIDVNARLREFRPLLERAASAAVQIVLKLDATVGLVRLDPGHFESAILNLVTNARDAMPEGGRIVLRSADIRLAGDPELADGDYVQVTVTDEGQGMDTGTMAKAFEPFFTTKDVGKGTGLGLSQVYGFARQAAGDVRIASMPGRGTSIELLLPACSDQLSPTLPGAEPGQDAPQPATVLVVEDDLGVLEMTVASLREFGYRIVTATSAPEALELLGQAGEIDLMFSDVVMPGGMNGVQLAAAAARLRPGLKVLLTSGYSGGAENGTMAETSFLSKPYDRDQLAARLRELLTA
jgi:two-component system NtrC family sensor kinase